LPGVLFWLDLVPMKIIQTWRFFHKICSARLIKNDHKFGFREKRKLYNRKLYNHKGVTFVSC
jgi:hypothetical protein